MNIGVYSYLKWNYQLQSEGRHWPLCSHGYRPLCALTRDRVHQKVWRRQSFLRSVTLSQPLTRLSTVPTHKTCHKISARVSLPKLILKIYFFLTVKYQNSYPNEGSRSICLVSNFVLVGRRWENKIFWTSCLQTFPEFHLFLKLFNIISMSCHYHAYIPILT